MRLALGGAAGLALGLAGWGCGRTMLLLELVDAGSTDGGPIVAVTTVAGTGRAGHADGIGGPSGVATFDGPCGLASDVAGNLYVADSRNHDIRKIDLRGNVTTLAGNGMDETADGTGGPNGTASFVNPYGLSIDHSGQLYVADAAASLIRRIDLFQNVVTFAGQTGQGFADGPRSVAMFRGPQGIAVDGAGNVFVADTGNNRIREIDTSGNVTTLAGLGRGYSDGVGEPVDTAGFDGPQGTAVDPNRNVFVADYGNNRIRRIDPSTRVTTVAGNGVLGDADGTGGPTGTAEFAGPRGVAADGRGNLIVTDFDNSLVRMVDAAGKVVTLAGTGKAGFADGSGVRGGGAEFNLPFGVTIDNVGNIYVSDFGGNRIRRLQILSR